MNHASSSGIIVPAIPLPAPGEKLEVQTGMKVWSNPGNEFLVIEVHYTAAKHRRGDWKERASKKYGGLNSWRWRKEFEIDWEAQQGALVFDNWKESVHVLKPRGIPEHWPRWVMIDPGWTNPTSILWIALDVDTVPNDFGYQPLHIYREFYKARYTPSAIAAITYQWSGGDGGVEWVEAVVLDPMAKQEHQGAQDGELVNEQAESFHSKFSERMADLGWSVPIDTGNNLKDAAIGEIIERLANYWVLGEKPLYDEDDRPRDPTLDELADGARYIAPTLFVHAQCESTIAELRKYRFRDWSDSQVRERHNAPERPVDKDDHSITNIIRAVNILRAGREENGVDLSSYRRRHRPARTFRTDEQILQDRHARTMERYRQGLRDQ